MKEGEEDYPNNVSFGNTRDLEETQRTLRERLILFGQNLIDFKEESEKEILELKKGISILKTNMEKIRDFIETLSGELNKFAKKEDLEILSKQAKLFQPAEFITKRDLEKLKNKKILK